MKLYGRRFADRYVQKKLKPRTETKDAIIFEVDWDAYVCKCRIQGSDEYINAHFPRNQATIPAWMKKGNAVRVLHRSGVRGHIEVVGNGGAIPTPMPGSPSHPPSATAMDGIISGLVVTSLGGLNVTISPGTYRIAGITYTADGNESGYPTMNEALPEMTMREIYPPADMGDPAGLNYELMDESDPPWIMSEADPPAILGSSGGVFVLDSILDGYFRYDALQIGTDGIIDYVKGTAAQSNPVKPVISGSHVQISGYILVYNFAGDEGIGDDNIGLDYTDPHHADLVITAISEMAWAEGADYPETTITVQVVNQYGYNISGARTFTAQMVLGTGWIWSSESGYQEDIAVVTTGGGSAQFVYRRDQESVPINPMTGLKMDCVVCETSPHIAISVTGGLEAFHHIQLLSRDGWDVSNTGDPHGYVGWLTVPQDSVGDADLDWEASPNQQVILEQDGKITFIGTPADGQKLVLLIRQNETGGWVPTLPTSVKYGDQITAANLSISIDANSRTYLGFIYDGQTGSYDIVANVSGY